MIKTSSGGLSGLISPCLECFSSFGGVHRAKGRMVGIPYWHRGYGYG